MSAPVVAIDVRRVKASAGRLSAQARGIAAELGRAYTMRLTLPTEDAQHLVWLDGGTQGQFVLQVKNLLPMPVCQIFYVSSGEREFSAKELCERELNERELNGRKLSEIEFEVIIF